MDSPAHHVALHLASLVLVRVPVPEQPAVRMRTADDMVLQSHEMWPVFVGTRPPDPSNAVTVYDTGGNQANADVPLYDPTIQISVRSVEYFAGYDKASEIRDALILPTSCTLSGWFYTGFWLISDVAKIGRDDNNRELFTFNLRAMRQRAA